jgi:hypothetical protein
MRLEFAYERTAKNPDIDLMQDAFYSRARAEEAD